MTIKTRHLKTRLALYVPTDMKDALEREAIRQDRSLSWLIKKSWEVALPTIQQFPSTE